MIEHDILPLLIGSLRDGGIVEVTVSATPRNPALPSPADSANALQERSEH